MSRSTHFAEGYLGQYLSGVEREMREQIAAMSGDAVLAVAADDLVEIQVERHKIDPPQLVEADLAIDELREQQFKRPGWFNETVQVHGGVVHVTVPMTGSRRMLAYQPSTSTMDPFSEDVTKEGLEFDVEVAPIPEDPDEAAKAVKESVASVVSRWRTQLEYFKHDIDAFNDRLPTLVRAEVDRRREQALRYSRMKGAIDLPLREKRPPETVAAAVSLLPKRIQLPAPAASASYRDEPRLDDKAYEAVLDRLRAMSHVIERFPAAFALLEEEHIRAHFLINLNALFDLEGTATGETFNGAGKTDILIRYRDANLFVAELKFWHGAKRFAEAIDQLLGYLTWRDSRAAIVLFVREQDFGRVVDEAVATIVAHPNFKREVARREDGGRFVLHLPGDKGREVSVALLAFHMPSTASPRRPQRKTAREAT